MKGEKHMRMNCAFSCDDAYIQHAGVCTYSIFKNNRDIEEIYIYFIDNYISDKYKEQLYEVSESFSGDGVRKIVFVDLYEISKELKVCTDFCRSTYGKLFMGQIEEVDRMLCFDCDTVCVGSLKPLLTMDLENATVWGVQDTVNPYFVKAIGRDSHYRYINCGGVIVLNLKKWREMDMEQQFVAYITEHGGNPPFVDQGAINKLCETGVLPPTYNVINPMFMYPVKRIKKLFKIKNYYTQSEIDDAKENPVVIHYTGERYNRPWCYGCDHPLKEYYLEILEMTPWAGNIIDKPLSKNCKIQNWIYDYCPFWVYFLMIRFIEVRHTFFKRSMKGDTQKK